jgi:adenosylcobinamide-GDP ribazoletransferase
MKSFLLALQFLSIIPVKINRLDKKEIAFSLVYFPLIGLLLGLVLVGINSLLLFLKFPRFSIDVILVISLVIITGGLHLDGLSDTCDALSSGKDKNGMLEIMRDSRAGVMGILSLISVILLKIALLYSITNSVKPVSLILMCSISRWALVWAVFLFSYAREAGKAKDFFEGITLKIFILATILILLLVIVSWWLKGLLSLMITAGCVWIIGKFISKKLNGVTGDVLGAINEITEVLVLLSVCILERINLWVI